MKLLLYYPVKPLHINQEFGANPDYYKKFLDSFGNPEKGHQGVDLMAVHGQPVYAAHDGMARYVMDSHGGEGIYIRTNDIFYSTGGQCWYTTIYWHLCSKDDPKFAPKIPPDGKEYPVTTGELIGFADNTGAPFESSGDHLHLGLFPCNQLGNPVFLANGFGGCIDPVPFFTGTYADVVPHTITLTKALVDALQKIINYLKSK